MTHSSTAKPTSTEKSQPKGWGRFGALRLLVALLLLGLGAGVGAMVGMTLALFVPGTVDQPPLSEQAIQQSERLLRLTQSDPNPTASTVGAIPGAVATMGDRQLKITIPTNSLFEADQTTLRPEARQTLEALVNELKPYSGSTIQVGAYTDASSVAGNNSAEGTASPLVLTFSQAKQVQQSLAQTLGNDYAWSVIGFGSIRSSTTRGGTVERDRRIELVVNP